KIDSTLLLATLAAQSALYLCLEHFGARPKFVGWPLVFWIALAAGVLLKGPIILAVFGVTWIAFAALDHDWKGGLAVRPLFGLPVLILFVLPWLIAITLKTHGQFLSVAIGDSIGGKLAGTSDRHAGPPGYHTILFMLTFFPGIVLAGLGVAYA